jgi:hypothetical protein
MSVLTDFLADALRDHVLRNTPYTAPTDVYLALFISPTTKAGGGTEVTGGSYSRISISFAAPSTGLAEQDTPITFNDMPGSTVTHIALMDASSGGNMMIIGRMREARTVSAGQPMVFAAADIRVLFD